MQQENQPITVTLFSDFARNPPLEYFEVREGPRHPIYMHNRQKINLCTHGSKKIYFPDSMGSEMKVNTLGELESLTERLLRNPIVFDAYLKRSSKTICDNVTYISQVEFVVTVWTQHPAIRSQLQMLLEKAKEDLRAGRKFAVNLNFTTAIKTWFKTLYAEEDIVCDRTSSYSCKDTKLCVTNDSEFMDCFSCNSDDSKCMWLICFQCCLLSCPCYWVHRYFTVDDHDGDIDASVAYQSLDPNQSGVMDLIDQMRREAMDLQYQQTGVVQQPRRREDPGEDQPSHRYMYPDTTPAAGHPAGYPSQMPPSYM